MCESLSSKKAYQFEGIDATFLAMYTNFSSRYESEGWRKYLARCQEDAIDANKKASMRRLQPQVFRYVMSLKGRLARQHSKNSGAIGFHNYLAWNQDRFLTGASKEVVNLKSSKSIIEILRRLVRQFDLPFDEEWAATIEVALPALKAQTASSSCYLAELISIAKGWADADVVRTRDTLMIAFLILFAF